jgi:L-fuculose-phosphate aldolase
MPSREQINLEQIKEEICDIGRRLYHRGFAAANDGNISCRIDENRIVCTPTGISKGFMKPDDLCVVDMEANQIAGHRKMTSEIRQHITIMKHRSDIKAVVHCHPPHATAFGMAREAIPQYLMPEAEINLGTVPIAKYTLPGGQEFADAILPFVHKSDIIIQANHGTVSYGATVEQAYFLVETLDAYCNIVLLARSLGEVRYFTKEEARNLLELKKKMGLADLRMDLTDEELCANTIVQDSAQESGVGHRAFQPTTFQNGNHSPDSNNFDRETLIKTIVEQVIQALGHTATNREH